VWCRTITGGYPGVDVTNMTEAWRSGLAFCAIIHRFRPDLIDFDNLVTGDPAGNCQLAFTVAERELGIPALLDPRDMANCQVIDKLSVLTYLAQFYHKFSGTGPQPAARGSRLTHIHPHTDTMSSTSPGSTDVHQMLSSSQSSSSSSSDVSTDSGLDQSPCEHSSSSSSRVSSVSPESSPLSSRIQAPESSNSFRNIIKSKSPPVLLTKTDQTRSYESLLEADTTSTYRTQTSRHCSNDHCTESSFQAALHKFNQLCSPSCSPSQDGGGHRSISSSGLRTESRHCQTESTVRPVLVNQGAQTEVTHMEDVVSPRQLAVPRQAGHAHTHTHTHCLQTKHTPRTGHKGHTGHTGHTGVRTVPNCDRSRRGRILSGIESYGEWDKILGKSKDCIGNSTQPSPTIIQPTHSTLV